LRDAWKIVLEKAKEIDGRRFSCDREKMAWMGPSRRAMLID
jgi:hypothetical protein